MGIMSSTTSQESQDSLHLQRQAVLYHVDMTLGNLIKKAREAKKMTQQALADEIGVSKQLVWQWEKGKSDARTHIKALSVHLEQPIEYFYATKRSPAVMEAKFKLLAPEEQAAVDALMDTFLNRRRAGKDDPVKLA
jgi:transcriptional regulator with XRE-family HTH domain